MKQNFKNLIQKISLMLCATAVTVSTSVTNLVAATLWDTGGAADKAVENFSGFYNHWFIVILGISAACYFFLGDEKKKGYARMVLIGSIIVRLLTSPTIQGIIEGTLDSIAGWFGA